MAWIKSDQNLANHPKLILLARELGISKVEALGHLHFLWYWVLEYADDGELKYLDLIPDACEWKGDEQVFLDALIKYGFIDTCYDSENNYTEYSVHDWLDYSGKYFEKKEANRLRVEKHRQNKANSDVTSNYKDVTEPLQEHYSNALDKNRIEKNRIEENNIGLATQDEVTSNSKKDVVFETLAEVCGYDWKGVMTKDERGRLNKAVKQLKDINATPEEIQLRAKNFVLAYGFHPQPQSITTMWTKLENEQPKLSKKQLEDLQRQAVQSGKWVELENRYGK